MALAPRYPIFFGIFCGELISDINAIRTGLINPNPMPPIIFATIYISKLKESAAINIAIANIINPLIKTGILPFVSEIAPEKS